MTIAGAQQSLTGHHMRENETGDVKEKDGETSCNSSGDRQILAPTGAEQRHLETSC